MKKETFLQHYAEQFDSGAVNRSNYLECASYLEGFRDAMTPQLSQEAINRFMRCESLLRGAENVINILERFRTPVHGDSDNGRE
jgi:hypothetical protein